MSTLREGEQVAVMYHNNRVATRQTFCRMTVARVVPPRAARLVSGHSAQNPAIPNVAGGPKFALDVDAGHPMALVSDAAGAYHVATPGRIVGLWSEYDPPQIPEHPRLEAARVKREELEQRLRMPVHPLMYGRFAMICSRIPPTVLSLLADEASGRRVCVTRVEFEAR